MRCERNAYRTRWKNLDPVSTGPRLACEGGESVAFSEAASKNTRGRGRPKAFSDKTMALVKSMCPEVRTRRGQLDWAYRLEAMRLLSEDPRFRWLYNERAMQRCEPKSWRPSILTELGRVSVNGQGKEFTKRLALAICKAKPKTKVAVRALQLLRSDSETDNEEVQELYWELESEYCKFMADLMGDDG